MKNLLDVLVKLGIPTAGAWVLAQTYASSMPWWLWPPLIMGGVFILSLYEPLIKHWPGYVEIVQQAAGQTSAGQTCPVGLSDTDRSKLGRLHGYVKRHATALENAEHLLSWAYHPQPLHPEGLARALIWAVGYTLLFWWGAWLLGGNGQLGSATLLPNVAVWQRWIFLTLVLTVAGFIFFAIRHPHRVTPFKLRVQSELVSVFLGLLFLEFTIFALMYWADWSLLFQRVFGTLVEQTVINFSLVTVTVAVALAIALALVATGAELISAIGVVPLAKAEIMFVAIPGAVAWAMAGAGAEVITGAEVLALHFGFGYLYIKLKKNYHNSASLLWDRLRITASMWLLYLPLLGIAASAPLWLPVIASVRPNWAQADQFSFALLFFLGFLPWLNAGFDFVSVGVTQGLLRRYQNSSTSGWWWMLFIDIGVAIGLTLLLYIAVLGALAAMKALGWGVDHSELLAILKEPDNLTLNHPSLWLWLLALTNVLPTLLHMFLTLSALFIGRLSRSREHLGHWQINLQNKNPLCLRDAQKLARLLTFEGWLTMLFVFSLFFPVVAGFLWLLPRLVKGLFV